MEFHMINIIYLAWPIRAQTEKTTFSCKDDCTLTKHTGRWTYSAKDFEIPLCHTPPLRSFFVQLKHLKSPLDSVTPNLAIRGGDEKKLETHKLLSAYFSAPAILVSAVEHSR